MSRAPLWPLPAERLCGPGFWLREAVGGDHFEDAHSGGRYPRWTTAAGKVLSFCCAKRPDFLGRSGARFVLKC